MTDISASVVVFDTDPAVLSQLLAGLANPCLRVKVTVVDNSSSDRLSAVVRPHGAQYLHTARNLGYGGGHNLALRPMLARTRYHLVLNPDILLAPDTLDRLFAWMEANPQVGHAMPRVLYPDGRDQHLCKLLPTPADLFARRFLDRFPSAALRRRNARYQLHGVDLSRPSLVPSLSGCFMFLRDAVLQRIGLFDERYFLYLEDVDLCRRVGSVAATAFLPEVAVVHGYQKGSYRQARLLRYHLTSAVRYFNKWGWWLDRERRALNRLAGRPLTPRLLDDLDRRCA